MRATMGMISLVTVVALLSCGLVQVEGASKDQAYRLYDDLFFAGGYNKYVRPSRDTADATIVFMKLDLLAIVDVDEKNQILKTNAHLILVWRDQLLSWTTTDYDGIASLFTAQENMWLPDIAVDNSVSKRQQIGFDDLPVRITAAGSVVWTPTILISTSCDINVQFYPFDTQVCDIDFVTIATFADEVDINIDETEAITLENFNEDGTWDLIDTHAKNLANDESKSKIRFQLLLKRRLTFYVVNIILPVLFLSLTAALVFALPAHSGEKMGTSITVLLAYAVYLTIVSGFLPNTSLQPSCLALYLAILLGITALSVAFTTFMLRLYHRPDTDPVGPKTAKFTIFLQTIMCLKKSQNPYQSSTARNSVAPMKEVEEDPPHSNRPASTIYSDPPEYNEPLTWVTVAETLDWFLFLLFSFLIFATTIICMIYISVGGAINAPTLDKSS